MMFADEFDYLCAVALLALSVIALILTSALLSASDLGMTSQYAARPLLASAAAALIGSMAVLLVQRRLDQE